MVKIISTTKAPAAVGPYSQAVVVGNLVFCSGQIGLDPKDGKLTDGIENQTRQALTNLLAVVVAAGSGKAQVVKTTIFLTNIDHFLSVNKIYQEFFADFYPARSTIEVKRLPKDALIEIEAVAVVK